ncbi:hypothetical protein CHH92_14860 [Bacillus sonorensis]|uniref:Uncharacterized protein n=1 Tax=Bacillus sonorensis L12 TaxID=1274524 RepID=M5PAL2_9BACI|nr:hypothetical protein BSONL12_02217 [Bacillus sonorensis L12]MBG9915553.1 hypothetical protein [Bacillus sonorensis]PAD59632.1 hypothetical protein CHH92_14860 [Bacillus sonorensis]RHJ09752.1 hypothetical protein DW143_10755 [Bacillus sonorensis]
MGAVLGFFVFMRCFFQTVMIHSIFSAAVVEDAYFYQLQFSAMLYKSRFNVENIISLNQENLDKMMV